MESIEIYTTIAYRSNNRAWKTLKVIKPKICENGW